MFQNFIKIRLLVLEILMLKVGFSISVKNQLITIAQQRRPLSNLWI